MKVIKKINNNVALCVDRGGNELIAFGKGVGFKEMPYELHDLSVIERTFYSVKNEYIPILMGIDEELFSDMNLIMQKIRMSLNKEINDSLFFVLIDHISFSIQRAKNKVYFQFSIANEVSMMYEEEMEVAKWIVNYLNKKYKIHLLQDEAAIIAIHIVGNYDDEKYIKEVEDESKIIQDITVIVENKMAFQLDRSSFNYSRFVSHLTYLLKRQQSHKLITSNNDKLFVEMKDKFPLTYQCTLDIRDYFENKGSEISDEELLYLMIHINRMIDRGDCYR